VSKEVARRLRSKPTEEERILRAELRKRRVAGLRFRRQHPIGPYTVDFVCLERRFIIEVDGVQHGEPANSHKDAHRTDWLESRGYRVFRAWNWEIRENLEGDITSMLGELGLLLPAEVTPHPGPPPQGGREGK
jgi:very-short-patch-repair endonuclease